MKRNIGGRCFEFLGSLKLARDSADRLIERTFQLPPGVKMNRYAAGPFCSFELPEASPLSGVYALTVNNSVEYIGETENLERRFGPTGYGRIVGRNLHVDGQSTNCKVNSLVLQVYQAGESVGVWFSPAASERKAIESRLVAALAPPWNGSRPDVGAKQAEPTHSLAAGSARGASRFDSALRSKFADATRSGEVSLRVRSGDLHRELGGYPGSSHQMPLCCRAMRAAMGPGDRIIESPPKGAGANLVVEYRLPRAPAV